MLRNQNNKKKCLCSGYCLVLIASKQLLLVEFYIFWNLSLCCDLPRNLFTSGKMPMKTLGVNVCAKAIYLSIYLSFLVNLSNHNLLIFVHQKEGHMLANFTMCTLAIHITHYAGPIYTRGWIRLTTCDTYHTSDDNGE